MNIYIDESGPFSPPISQNKLCFSSIGALIVPSDNETELFNSFNSLKREWGYSDKEMKGSKINETQFSQLINVLKIFDLTFESTSIDLSSNTPNIIAYHKENQIKGLSVNLNKDHHESVHEKISYLSQSMEKLSHPLYLQYTCMIHLIDKVFRKSVLYYGQRHPEELSAFNWIVDAKNIKITTFEDTWKTLLLPHLQHNSLSNPLDLIKGCDYSYFDNVYSFKIEDSKYHKSLINDKRNINSNGINLKKVFGEQISFQDSKSNLGIQIIDILISGLRRTLNGKLKKSGWNNIGQIMSFAGKTYSPVSLIDLKRKRTLSSSYVQNCINHINQTSKKLIL